MQIHGLQFCEHFCADSRGFLRVCIESVAIISKRWMDVSSPVVHVLGDEGDCLAVLSSKRGTRFFQ